MEEFKFPVKISYYPLITALANTLTAYCVPGLVPSLLCVNPSTCTTVHKVHYCYYAPFYNQENLGMREAM